MTVASLNLLTPPQAAKFLNISDRSLWELKRTGKVKFLRVGKRLIRYDPADLREWVESNKEVNDAEPGGE